MKERKIVTSLTLIAAMVAFMARSSIREEANGPAPIISPCLKDEIDSHQTRFYGQYFIKNNLPEGKVLVFDAISKKRFRVRESEVGKRVILSGTPNVEIDFNAEPKDSIYVAIVCHSITPEA